MLPPQLPQTALTGPVVNGLRRNFVSIQSNLLCKFFNTCNNLRRGHQRSCRPFFIQLLCIAVFQPRVSKSYRRAKHLDSIGLSIKSNIVQQSASAVTSINNRNSSFKVARSINSTHRQRGLFDLPTFLRQHSSYLPKHTPRTLRQYCWFFDHHFRLSVVVLGLLLTSHALNVATFTSSKPFPRNSVC